jgi:hypothetical protein
MNVNVNDSSAAGIALTPQWYRFVGAHGIKDVEDCHDRFDDDSQRGKR